MEPAYQSHFIANMNTIEEGLNFLVPTKWWEDFCQRNLKIKNYKQMSLDHNYPLDIFYETGVIEQQWSVSQAAFQSTLDDSRETLTSIKEQLRRAQNVERIGCGVKRGRVPCEWLAQKDVASVGDVDLLLVGPRIDASMAELFNVNNEDWRIINPELYRNIYEIQTRQKGLKCLRFMHGLPVLIRKQHSLYIDQTINYSTQKYIEIYINNHNGKIFSFCGWVDSSIKYKKLLKWINEGMYKLTVSSSRQKFIFKRKNMIMKINNQQGSIIFDFYDEEYNQRLDWLQFRSFAGQKIGESQISRMIVFSGSHGEQQKEPERGFRKIRRVDSNISAASDDEVRYTARAEIRPIVLQENGRRKVEVIDVHSSTQEQTPSDLGQRDAYHPGNSLSTNKQERIAYAIWRDPCLQKLIQLAKIRSKIPRLYKPYCDQGTIIIKDEGRKTVLPKQSNQLFIDDQGNLKQKQEFQRIIAQDEMPSASVCHQLQLLACEISGMKISEGDSQVKKVEVDLAKEKDEDEECEDRTCKNDFMDEFDCEESREG